MQLLVTTHHYFHVCCSRHNSPTNKVVSSNDLILVCSRYGYWSLCCHSTNKSSEKYNRNRFFQHDVTNECCALQNTFNLLFELQRHWNWCFLNGDGMQLMVTRRKSCTIHYHLQCYYNKITSKSLYSPMYIFKQ